MEAFVDYLLGLNKPVITLKMRRIMNLYSCQLFSKGKTKCYWLINGDVGQSIKLLVK